MNQKIYRRFFQFQDFQFVFLTTKDQKTNINNLKEELTRGVGTDLEKWNFIFTDEKEIQKIYNSLKTDIALSEENNTPYVFIIDRDLNLRGRDDDEDAASRTGAEECNRIFSIHTLYLTSERAALVNLGFKIKLSKPQYNHKATTTQPDIIKSWAGLTTNKFYFQSGSKPIYVQICFALLQTFW